MSSAWYRLNLCHWIKFKMLNLGVFQLEIQSMKFRPFLAITLHKLVFQLGTFAPKLFAHFLHSTIMGVVKWERNLW